MSRRGREVTLLKTKMGTLIDRGSLLAGSSEEAAVPDKMTDSLVSW